MAELQHVLEETQAKTSTLERVFTQFRTQSVTEREKLQKELAGARAEADERVRGLAEQLKEAKGTAERVQRELDSVRSAGEGKEAIERRAAESQEAVAALKEEIRELQKDLEKAGAEAGKARDEVEKVRKEAAAGRTGSDAEQARLLAEAEKSRAEAKEQVHDLEQQVVDARVAAEREIESLKISLKDLEAKVVPSADGDERIKTLEARAAKSAGEAEDWKKALQAREEYYTNAIIEKNRIIGNLEATITSLKLDLTANAMKPVALDDDPLGSTNPLPRIVEPKPVPVPLSEPPPETVAAPAPEPAEAPVAEPAPEPVSEAPPPPVEPLPAAAEEAKKKGGFFSRLFGKK